MKTKTMQKRKTESLLKYINTLDKKYYKAVTRSTGIEFGYGMRAYQRLKTQAFPEDKIKNNFKNVIEELKSRNFDTSIINVSWLKLYKS